MDVVIVAARVLLSLAAVLALLVFLQRRLTKGTTRRRRTNPLSVVARTGVGSKASVVVVEVEGRRFVLGVTEHNIAVLHTADAGGAAATDAVSEPAVSAEQVPARVPLTLVPTAVGESASVDADFERVLADADLGAAAAHDETQLRRTASSSGSRDTATRGNHRAIATNGSILSRDTWRATAAFLRQDR